ncbi:unnamed protein product [Pleuronectes platessa]|uniref:Uncharacterized protein n=1 Tax=Pleuronectes platessa TaxID=8262 RepID=A0A9N7UNE8_PLEPL|nr:unnamed protein product [Pleuronectes platessa]
MRAARKALQGAAERPGEGVPRWRRRSYRSVSVKTEKHTLALKPPLLGLHVRTRTVSPRGREPGQNRVWVRGSGSEGFRDKSEVPCSEKIKLPEEKTAGKIQYAKSSELTEREKKKQREKWRASSSAYRERKNMANALLEITPPSMENIPQDLVDVIVPYDELPYVGQVLEVVEEEVQDCRIPLVRTSCKSAAKHKPRSTAGGGAPRERRVPPACAVAEVIRQKGSTRVQSRRHRPPYPVPSNGPAYCTGDGHRPAVQANIGH